MLQENEKSASIGEIEWVYGNYRGIVVDNNDPLVKGRLKIYVPGVYPEELAKTPKSLPWAEPAMSLFGGSWANEREGDLNNEVGISTIPHTSSKVLNGAQVWVFFEQGEWNMPIYFAACQSGPGWLSEHNNQHVIKTDNVRIRVDENPSGDNPLFKPNETSTCKFDTYNKNCNSNGNIVTEDVPTTVDIEVLGNVNIIVNGNVNMHISGDYYEEHTGDKYETLSGNLYRKHIGDVYFQHEGDVLHEHEGDRTYIQTGDQTEYQKGDQSYTQDGDKTYVQNGDKTMIQKGDHTNLHIGDDIFNQKGDKTTTQIGDLLSIQIGTKRDNILGDSTYVTFKKETKLTGDYSLSSLKKIVNTGLGGIENNGTTIQDKAGVITHN